MKNTQSPNLTRAVEYLLKNQHPEGYWNAHLETNCCMEAQWLMASVFCGIDYAKNAEILDYIRNCQRKDGSWDVYYKAENGDVNTTLECYVALRLFGESPDSEIMSKAREWLISNEWYKHIRVFTKYWLALFGEWPWEETPALPPEIIYFPKWFPFNIYRFAAWARATIMPLCVVTSQKPVKIMPREMRLDELFPEGRKPSIFKREREKSVSAISIRKFFLAADRVFHFYNTKSKNSAIRKKAIKKAMQWILNHQDDDGFWGGIQPPWIYGIIAMKLEGFGPENENMAKAVNALNLHWTESTGKGRRIKASESPVWDTMLALNSLLECGLDAKIPEISKAADYLMAKENKHYGDWSQTVGEFVEPSGWSFQRENKYYPDIDDTAVAIIALEKFRKTLPPTDPRVSQIPEVVSRAVKWILAMRSDNGAWGAFDRNNTSEFLTHIPFCDFGEVLDPPSADVTAHVIEALIYSGMSVKSPEIKRGIDFILSEQESNGAWFGRWGINYIYGTWCALGALAAAGYKITDSSVRRGIEYLTSMQNPDGGWGENASTYLEPNQRGESTASQTAWAVIALQSFEGGPKSAIERGLDFLKNSQRKDGTWDERAFTGTGFPGYGLGAKVDIRDGKPLPQGKELSRGFMLRYGYYCHYFPILALSKDK